MTVTRLCDQGQVPCTVGCCGPPSAIASDPARVHRCSRTEGKRKSSTVAESRCTADYGLSGDGESSAARWRRIASSAWFTVSEADAYAVARPDGILLGLPPGVKGATGLGRRSCPPKLAFWQCCARREGRAKLTAAGDPELREDAVQVCAEAAQPIASKASRASRSGVRDSAIRRWRRSHWPCASNSRAR